MEVTGLKSMSYWKGHGEAVGASVEVGYPSRGRAALKLGHFRSGWFRDISEEGAFAEACLYGTFPTLQPPGAISLCWGWGMGISHMADAAPL